MAVTNTLKDNDSDTSVSSKQTASMTSFTNGQPIALWVISRATTPPTPTASGLSCTWLNIKSVAFDSSAIPGAGQIRISLLVGYRSGSAPANGRITITWSGTQDEVSYAVVQMGGVITTEGTQGVIQTVSNTGNSTTPSVTLAAFADAGNATQGGVALANDAAVTAGSGFTELVEEQNTASPGSTLEVEFKATNDTGVDWSVSSVPWGAIGVEWSGAAPSKTASGAVSLPSLSAEGNAIQSNFIATGAASLSQLTASGSGTQTTIAPGDAHRALSGRVRRL